MNNKAIDMVAENATTTMPGINNAARMTSTSIAFGSVAEDDSSGSVSVHDSYQTNKGNKIVSIMSDFFFEHGIKCVDSLYFFASNLYRVFLRHLAKVIRMYLQTHFFHNWN